MALGYVLDGAGITYKKQAAVRGTSMRIDDDLLLWMLKRLRHLV